MNSNQFKIPESILVVVHTNDAQVLLMKRVVLSFWQSITGSLNSADEPPESAARRELFEETGIVAGDNLKNWHTTREFEILKNVQSRFAPGVTHNKEHAFSLALPQTCEIKLDPEEHSEYVWLPFDQAAEKMWSWSNREALHEIAQAQGWPKVGNGSR